MGTPKFAVPSLEILIRNGYNIPFVVTVPDKKQGRGLKIQYSEIKQFALNNNFEVIQPEILKDEALINKIKSAKPDLIVVVAFRILPKEIFTIPKLGTINVHASLLPKYRGAAPINWALINGEKETGVTTFLIDEKVDTGNILLQKRVDIDDTDNFESLYNKLSVIGSVLLLDTIIKIKEESITTSFQNNSLATPAPKITKEHCKINWSLKSVQIHNLIR
jgi:methionyl-tRNA formyltransferase